MNHPDSLAYGFPDAGKSTPYIINALIPAMKDQTI